MRPTALVALALLVPQFARAVEYECKVERKLDGEHVYTAKELRDGQFSVRIHEAGSAAVISRCSFSPSERRVTCDEYEVDHIASDTIQKFDGDRLLVGEYASIKKYYRFRGQFDVQLFPSLRFIENNGRGGFAFGTCRIVSP